MSVFQDVHDKTPLTVASTSIQRFDRNTTAAQYAICIHIHVLESYTQGETPLIAASARCEVLDLRLLIAAGCDCNATTEDGSTALMEAASAGYLDCIKILIEHKADCQLKKKVTLIYMIAGQNHYGKFRSYSS